MIVTIDGPAGAGKSSVARMLASRLGYRFLDTGAMYRTVAWAVRKAGKETIDEPAALEELLNELDIQWRKDRIYLNRSDVSDAIRTPEISQLSSMVAQIPAVRERMVELQREIARHGDYVCEGRDQGTVVFPNAACKIFLTASAKIRAKRRWEELKKNGAELPLHDVVAEQKIRDLRDEKRAVGRLIKAEDAIEVSTDDKTLEQIVDELESIVRAETE